MYHQRGVSSGEHSFVAEREGKHVYCFSNDHSSTNSKMVSFNVHGVQFVPKTEEPIDPLQDEGTYLTLSVLLPCILKFRISTSKGLELRNSGGLYNDPE